MPTSPDPCRVLVVLGHGRTESLCHHLTDVVRRELDRLGAEHRLHDLLADGFDPVARLAPGQRHLTACTADEDPLLHRYQQDVRWAEALVFVHPVWWFAPPAILKGWVDRVLVDGIAIRQPEEGSPEPLLDGRCAILVHTFNAPRVVDAMLFRGIASMFWRRVVFPSVGIKFSGRVALYGVEDLEANVLERECDRLRKAVGSLLARCRR